MGKGAKKIYDDAAGAIEKAVNDSGRFLQTTVGEDGLGGWIDKNTGNVFSNVTRETVEALAKTADAYAELQMSGIKAVDRNTGGKLDLFTGNLLSDFDNFSKTTGDLLRGKEVESNLKSGARVGIVGAVAVGTGGTATAVGTATLAAAQGTANLSKGSWNEILDNAIQVLPVPKIVKDIAGNIVNPPFQAPQFYAADSGGYAILGSNNSKIIPIIVIGSVLIGAVIIITAKKRKGKK